MSTAVENVIEPPTTEHGNLTLGGDSFATKIAERKAASAEKPPVEIEKVEPPPKQVEPPAKIDEKVTPPAKEDKPAEKVPGKTPLDLTPPEKKEAAPADEEIAELLKSEPPANASASSKANHAAMRKGLEHANKKILALTADVAVAKGRASMVPEDVQERLTAAETAVKERDALIERVAFEKSPRYQKFITEGEAELTAAKTYLEGSEINPNVIDVAARTTGAKRIALLTESRMEQATISAVMSNLTRADAINRDRDAAQENWKATQSDWNAEQTKAGEARAAQVKANEDKVFSAVRKELSEKYAPFQIVDGNDDWNAGVKERNGRADLILEGKAPLNETAMVVEKGVHFDVIYDAFGDLRTKYNDLVAETGRIKAARPGAASGKVESGTAASTGDPMKDAASTFNEMRAKRGL